MDTICALFIYIIILDKVKKKAGWNLCFEAVFKKFIYFNQRIINL